MNEQNRNATDFEHANVRPCGTCAAAIHNDCGECSNCGTEQSKPERCPVRIPIAGTINMATGRVSLNPLGLTLLAKPQRKPAA